MVSVNCTSNTFNWNAFQLKWIWRNSFELKHCPKFSVHLQLTQPLIQAFSVRWWKAGREARRMKSTLNTGCVPGWFNLGWDTSKDENRQRNKANTASMTYHWHKSAMWSRGLGGHKCVPYACTFLFTYERGGCVLLYLGCVRPPLVWLWAH